ncbi:MAG TPA: hypothetical protein VH087_06680 [Thermoanaerobaculia bacterium]|jgi:hypothetical protein|nr:hypothetical protein [Thermoanaerobaculia bacterium]
MSHNMRLVLGGAVVLCIAAGAFQPFYWRIFTANRGALRAAFGEAPYRRSPGLHRFLLDVRERTRDGERIAFVMPPGTPAAAYEAAFMRPVYVLYGRSIVPMPYAAGADAIAAYGVDVNAKNFARVWASRDGVLLRRVP